MDYRDRKGNIIQNTTGQDKFLDYVYSNIPGRAVMKIMSAPKISRMAGGFLNTWPSTFFIGPFIRKNHIPMGDYERRKYKSYNEFFTRKIRPEKRPIDRDPSHLIAPCDGKVMVYPISLRTKIKIKHSTYSIASLLRNKALAREFAGGLCIVLRLTVDNYHRYCYVDHAVKGRNNFIPGRLHTVNPAVLGAVRVYKENARSWCVLDTRNFGKVVQMEVGAMLVGKINNYHREAVVKRGQEKGRFEFGGSTVVLLIGRDQVAMDEDILRNSAEGVETLVSMGESIGQALFP